jgi:iron complex transport system substrate-binding protein
MVYVEVVLCLLSVLTLACLWAFDWHGGRHFLSDRGQFADSGWRVGKAAGLLGSIVIVWLCLVGQSCADQSGSQRCVTDSLGRHICIPRAPSRIISLAPSLTEIVFMLGAGQHLVGRTTLCNRPPEARAIEEVGAYMHPNVERIISLRPDLVLAPRMGLEKVVVDQLTDLGIPVFVDDSSDLDAIVDLVLRLGTLLDRRQQAERIARAARQHRTALARRLTAATVRPSVLFVVGLRPLVVASGKSFLGALIREAGGSNIAEDAPRPFPRFSLEEVIRRDPDVIIVLNKECRGKECLRKWLRYPSLKAVQRKAIHVVDADLMTRPTPNLVNALDLLFKILHPGEPIASHARAFPSQSQR